MVAACVFVFGYLGQLNDSLGLSYDNYITGTKSGLSNMTDFIMRSAYLISFVYIFKGKVFEEGINRLLLVILLFSTILAFFGTSFSLLGRLVRYFTPAVMIMVPIAMKIFEIKCLDSVSSEQSCYLIQYQSFVARCLSGLKTLNYYSNE